MKVIFRNSQYMVLYECFGVELVDGVCPPEREEIQIWGRQHVTDLAIDNVLRDIALQRTCVNVDNMIPMPKNGE